MEEITPALDDMQNEDLEITDCGWKKEIPVKLWV